MNPITLRVFLAIGIWAAQATGQVPMPHPTLEKALLVEESEGNPAAALALFEQVARDRSAPAEVRTVAWLRSGLCLRRIGREDDARVAFTQAAEGKGDAAKAARRALAGHDPQEDIRLQSRVHGAITKLRATGEQIEVGRQELIWIGRPAVPYLVVAVDDDRMDLDFVRVIVSVISDTGGPETVAYLARVAASKDALLKRAVIRGLETTRPEVTAAAEKLLDDTDEVVRREAFVKLGRKLSVSRLLSLTEDRDPDMAARSLAFVLSQWSELDVGADRAKIATRLYDACRRGVASGHEGLQSVAVRYLTRPLEIGPWNTYFLETLPRPEIADQARARFDSAAAFSYRSDGGPVPDHRAVVACASKMGPLEVVNGPKGSYFRDLRHQRLLIYIERIRTRWGREALPSVVALTKLGYDYKGILTRWMTSTLQADDVPALVPVIAKLGDKATAFEWMKLKGAPPAVLGPVDDWLTKIENERPANVLLNQKEFTAAVALVATLDAESATRILVRLGSKFEFYELAVHSVCRARSHDVARRHLPALILIEGLPVGAKRIRNQALARLCYGGVPEAIELLPKAYELGLVRSGLVNSQGSFGNWPRRGLDWLLADFSRPTSHRAGVRDVREDASKLRFAAESIARAVDRTLDGGVAEAWSDALKTARYWAQYLGDSRRSQQPGNALFAESVFAVLCRRALDHPDVEGRARLVGALLATEALPPKALASAQELAAKALAHADRDLRLTAVTALKIPATGPMLAPIRALLADEDPEVVEAAAEALFNSDHAAAADDFAKLMGHELASVRVLAAKAFIRLAPERATAAVIEQLADENEWVRSEACDRLKKLLDRDAVPALIEVLKDDADRVRKSAQAALEAIQFYVEQKSRWERLLTEEGLDSGSAAEALVRQSGDGNPKEVRLAAIKSLGTLGVAETLPFLIKLMGDADPEIAGAAKAAVDRINAAPPGKK